MTLLWGVLLGALAVFFFLLAHRKAKWQVGICLLGLIFSCTPGLSVSRSNLVFIPTLFFSLVLAIAFFELLTFVSDRNPVKWFSQTDSSYTVLSVLLVLICTFAVGGSLYRSIVLRLDMHPYSINQILRDYDFIHGESAQKKPTIPDERREFLIEKLSSLGIVTGSKDPYLIIYDLYDKGKIMKWWSVFSVDNWKHVFVPIAVFLTP